MVKGLRAAGHDVMWVVEFGPGWPDERIIVEAIVMNCIILTQDHDFTDLVFRDGEPAHGLIRCDFPGMRRAAKATWIIDAVNAIDEAARHQLHVIERGRIRNRPLPRGNVAP